MGIGYGTDIDCVFGQSSATALKMSLFASAFCETEFVEPEILKNNIDINSIMEVGGLNRNQRDLMLIVLIMGLIFLIYFFVSRYKGKRIRIRDRNL